MTAPVRVGPYPSPQKLATLVASGQQQIHTLVAQELEVVERHNAYVDYCLALLIAGTGHRAVQDPFESIDQFDLDTGLLLVSDKVVEETPALHLAALPTMVAAQVRAYRMHLVSLGPGHHPLRAIATARGHAQETTTVGTYVHGADAIAHALLASDAAAGESRLRNFAAAYCLRVAHSTIRTRRRRAKRIGQLIPQALRAAHGIPDPAVARLPRANP